MRSKSYPTENDTGRDNLVSIRPYVCLFHASDLSLYVNDIKTVVDSCQNVMLYSESGAKATNKDLPEKWILIPRQISGRYSVNIAVWTQLKLMASRYGE